MDKEDFKNERKKKKGKLHRTAKAQCRCRFITTIKNVTERKKKLKSLIRFHRANKIDHYNRGRGEVIKRKKNPKESTEQVKR